MKISRVRHVIITSIIFLFIILGIVLAGSAYIRMLEENVKEEVYRIVATRDIEPGEEITAENVERHEISNALDANGMIYRLREADHHVELVEEAEAGKTITKEDGLWAVGKIAKDRIYKGEILLSSNLILSEDYVSEETRLYAIPFESATTGGYNVKIGETVDICLLYNDDEKTISEYQSLPVNKAIDIVLAGKQIEDIRDESGNSAKQMAAVVPGYVCFNLTYEEINKVELARRQGTLFIGNAENYYKEGTQAETFMPGAVMPNF